VEDDLGGKYKEFRGLLGIQTGVGRRQTAARGRRCGDGAAFFGGSQRQGARPLALNVRKRQPAAIIVSSQNTLDG